MSCSCSILRRPSRIRTCRPSSGTTQCAESSDRSLDLRYMHSRILSFKSKASISWFSIDQIPFQGVFFVDTAEGAVVVKVRSYSYVLCQMMKSNRSCRARDRLLPKYSLRCLASSWASWPHDSASSPLSASTTHAHRQCFPQSIISLHCREGLAFCRRVKSIDPSGSCLIRLETQVSST